MFEELSRYCTVGKQTSIQRHSIKLEVHKSSIKIVSMETKMKSQIRSTVYPEIPCSNFNEWIAHIKKELEKMSIPSYVVNQSHTHLPVNRGFARRQKQKTSEAARKNEIRQPSINAF
jgi:hypothetical protein